MMIGETTQRSPAIAALVGASLLLLVGCGPMSSGAAGATTTSPPSSSSSASCQQVGTVSFDKTKFVLHAGLAFGAFHHFIYSRFTSGAFRSGASGRVKNLIEAGLAAAFTVHELKLAHQDAESSPTLCKLVAPLDQAAAALSGITGKVKSGDVTQGDLSGINDSVATAGQSFAKVGVPVTDQIPSTGQLANPN
ncbi:MAG TPA: hypothetical protein VG756_13860 [Pseudonocardiaceae bacterium]|nr:hypothetical protein [Pseudonocardiaceae bacterium]